MEIKGIKYTAPFLDNSGYAQASRGNILSLDSLGIPLTLRPISFEEIRPNLGKRGDKIQSLIERDVDYNINFIHTTPEFWEKYRERGKFNIGYTIWETTKLHPAWPEYINNSVDMCMVGSEWNVETFKRCGVKVPVVAIPHGISMSEYEGIKPFNVKGVDKDTFMFYSIFQWCYDDKTRVLTKGGFKYFKDLDYEDEIATLNRETDVLEYHKPEKIVKFRRKDSMFKLSGSQFNICVTPDHKMVVKEHAKNSYKSSTEDNWELKPLNEMIINTKSGDIKISGKYRAKKNCLWCGKVEEYFLLPGDKKPPFKKIKMDDFLEFFGWYLSEGSLEASPNYYRVVITQIKNEQYRKEIWDCIYRMGFNPINHGKDILFNSKDFYNFLKNNVYKNCEDEGSCRCYNKLIPKEYKNLSSKQIKILLTSMMKGDGSFHKNGTWCKYVTTSKTLAEDFQECLLKIGYSGSISTFDPTKKTPGKIGNREIISKRIQYTVSVNRENNEPSMYYAKLEEIPYDGYVYCATVPNHAMLVEREGKVIFSGNTERKHPLAMVKAFWYAFQNNEKVALVLKTYRGDYTDDEKDAILTTLKSIKNVTPMDSYPPIFYISDMLSNDEIYGLHARGDCYVSLDRGEGFGLSPFAAGAAGNPIIVTNFGGSLEYAKEENSYLCGYTLTPVYGMPWSPWYRGDQLWAEPDLYHGAQLMKYVFENQQEARLKGQLLKKHIADNFSWRKIGQKIVDAIRNVK